MVGERDERAAITVALASAGAAALSRGWTGTVGLERLDDVDQVDELDVAERAEAAESAGCHPGSSAQTGSTCPGWLERG